MRSRVTKTKESFWHWRLQSLLPLGAVSPQRLWLFLRRLRWPSHGHVGSHRPVGGCVTDLCQLNTMLEAQMYADSNESDLVYTYIALAQHNMPPTFTFGVTLVGVASMDAHRKEPGKAEEMHILGLLLDSTRIRMIVKSESVCQKLLETR